MLDILERIKFAAHAGSDAELSRKMGISQQSVAKARTSKVVPASWLPKVSKLFDVSMDWLYFGRGLMRLSADGAEESLKMLIKDITDQDNTEKRQTTVPVVGLASCGVSGWYNPGPLAIRASVPVSLPNSKELFAVIAVGTSMQPDGIRQGYLLFCDPTVAPDRGDAVFVQQKDGHASVKRYAGVADGWLTLEGWGPPGKDGVQKLFTEQILMSVVQITATVILVQRKA